MHGDCSRKKAISSESKDGIDVSIPEDTEQSLGVREDLDRAGQSSGSQRSKGSAGQSLGKASSRGQGQSSSQDDPLIRELRRMESSLKSSIESVSNRMDRLEADHGGPPARKKARTEHPYHWADRNDVVDYSAAVQWPLPNDEEDMEEGSAECARGAQMAIKLSKANATLISASVLPNTERQRIRDAFPTTKLAETRCPCLDALFRSSSVKQEVKTADAELARIQALVHDPMAPLIRLQHAFDEEDGESLPLEAAKSALADAIRLIGNASANISQLRNRKILKAIRLLTLTSRTSLMWTSLKRPPQICLVKDLRPK